VQIHHSRDLIHWRLIARPLNRASQLDMRGDPDSCGIWAPCLTHAGGLFHLVYTDVKRYGRTTTAGASGVSLRDFHNYLVTSERINGDWSDPTYLNSSGFDPSLFHDDDGRVYLVNMLWDHRPGQNRFAGIVLQEYAPARRKLVGARHNIFKGTPLGLTEAPHLYIARRLVLLGDAEGGIAWGACRDDGAIARAARAVRATPRRPHPQRASPTRRNPTARGPRRLVETQSGETYMVYLCGAAARQPRAVHARTRDRDSADDMEPGRLAAARRRPKAFRWRSCRRHGG
jgi:xylan 1,4-beta-xylosidase